MKSYIANKFYQIILQDKCRYGRGWYLHPGFWVVFSYRIRRFRKHCIFPFNLLLLPIDIFFSLVRSYFSSVRLPSSVAIGPGLYLAHPDGVIINSMCSMGSGVSLFQQVTLGEWNGKAPIIEDGVAVFAGAKIFGGIVIGANSKIGANSVVNFDVSNNSTVAPARSSIVTTSRNTKCA